MPSPNISCPLEIPTKLEVKKLTDATKLNWQMFKLI